MKQTDIYTEALTCLRSILLADHPEFQNWIDWLERDIEDWTQRREVAHHLRAYGGMGSFNDLPGGVVPCKCSRKIPKNLLN